MRLSVYTWMMNCFIHPGSLAAIQIFFLIHLPRSVFCHYQRTINQWRCGWNTALPISAQNWQYLWSHWEPVQIWWHQSSSRMFFPICSHYRYWSWVCCWSWLRSCFINRIYHKLFFNLVCLHCLSVSGVSVNVIWPMYCSLTLRFGIYCRSSDFLPVPCHW